MLVIDDQPIALPSGTHVLGPAAIPDGLTRFEVSLARMSAATPTLWTSPATQINADFKMSINGGEVVSLFRFSASGGTAIDGAERAGISARLPAGINRVGSLTVAIVNGPLTSNLRLDVT